MDFVGLYTTESNKVCYYNTGNDVLAHIMMCVYGLGLELGNRKIELGLGQVIA